MYNEMRHFPRPFWERVPSKAIEELIERYNEKSVYTEFSQKRENDDDTICGLWTTEKKSFGLSDGGSFFDNSFRSSRPIYL